MKKALILLFFAITFYFGGNKLSAIYGFDPPYILYFSGLALNLISYPLFVSGIILLTFTLVKKYRSQ